MNKNRKLSTKVILALIGAIGGFLYWKFIGCESGTCPIKSVWYYSTLWGLLMGYVIGDILGSILWKRAAENE